MMAAHDKLHWGHRIAKWIVLPILTLFVAFAGIVLLAGWLSILSGWVSGH